MNVTIRLAEPHERAEAITFAGRLLERQYRNRPDPATTPATLFVAHTERGQITGTLAVATPNQLFGGLYECAVIDVPVLCTPATCVLFCRWTAQHRDVSIRLLKAAAQWAHDRHYTVGTCIIKPGVLRLLHRYQLAWQAVSTARLVRERVTPADAGYFFVPPLPLPCVIGLRDLLTTA